MKFENKQELTLWLREFFTNTAPEPKPDKVGWPDERWNVKEGDFNLLIRKESNQVFLSYVAQVAADGESFVEWYKGLGKIMTEVFRLNRKEAENKRNLFEGNPIPKQWQQVVAPGAWETPRDFWTFLIKIDMEDFENYTLSTKNDMRCSDLFRSYYVYPFNRDTIKYFLNWSINPLEEKR